MWTSATTRFRAAQYLQRGSRRISIFRAMRLVFEGDDHINPKKLLERRYLYAALLATNFRVRRNNVKDTIIDDNDVLDQVLQELGEKKLDRMSNVDLRREVQLMLEPQVLEAMQAMDRVDTILGIHGHGVVDTNDGERNGSFDRFNWDPYVAILLEERQMAQSRVQQSADSRKETASELFYKRKLGAIESLLNFHGLKFNEGSSEHNQGGGEQDDFGNDMNSVSKSSYALIRLYQTINICRSVLIRKDLGYSILSLKSLIPGGGRGVFVDGKAPKGAVVAFQPGEIWPKEHLLTTSADVMNHFEGDDDCHISLRFDDYVLDSRASPVTVLAQEGSMNPWAIGHMVNHPEKGNLPNCQSTQLDYTERMNLESLERYIPNVYARPPGWHSRFFYLDPLIMHGLCLIARRDVEDEELVYDYRLQSNETPEWYTPVRYGEDFDEEQVVFFRDDWMK